MRTRFWLAWIVPYCAQRYSPPARSHSHGKPRRYASAQIVVPNLVEAAYLRWSNFALPRRYIFAPLLTQIGAESS